jgi:putative ABC transport system permease protein
MAHAVTQRTSEIGIRLAIGASRGQVLLAIVGQAFKLSSAGVAIGSLAGLLLTRFVANLLYGVRATDPLTFVATAGSLILVALAASYLPARRAAAIDPVEALRKE